jgi:hypothetical protein
MACFMRAERVRSARLLFESKMDGGLAFVLDEDTVGARPSDAAGAADDDSEILDAYSRAVIGAADKVASAVVHVRPN